MAVKAQLEDLCANCHVWRLDPADTYCSWCGHQLIGFDIEPTQLPQLFQDRLPEEPLRILVRNVGQVPLELIELASSVEWLEVTPGAIEDLDASAERYVMLTLIPGLFPEGHERAEIAVTAGDDLQRVVILELHPPLKLSAQVTGGPVRLTEAEHPLTVEIRALVGQAELVSIVGEEASWCSFTPKEHWPFTVSSGLENAARITAIVDEARLAKFLELTQGERRPGGGPRMISLPLAVKTSVNEVVALPDLSFEVIAPPMARLLNVNRTPRPFAYDVAVDPVHCGTQREVAIGIHNDGDEELILESVSLAPDAQGWLLLAEGQTFPAVVAERSSASNRTVSALTFKIDASFANAEAELRGDVHLRTNSFGAEEMVVTFTTVTKAMSDYVGTVAIDFGTTNSCVVYQGPGEPPQAAPLEGIASAQPSVQARGPWEDTPVDAGGSACVAPSVVLYRSLREGEPREYDVGAKAREQLKAASAAASLVVSAKRWLGSSRTYVVWGKDDHNRQSLSACDVCTDIISFLIKATERHIHHRITSCAITHPVRFTTNQVQELTAAFESCGVTVSSTLSEPVAAGLDFIRAWDVPKYSLLVCDLGGGTSDLCLMKVERMTTDDRQTVIRPTILGADTDNWFGGDDVTEAFMKEIHRRAQEDSDRTFPLCRPQDRLLVRDPLEAEHGVVNWFFLWEVAEDAKVRLSEEHERRSKEDDGPFEGPIAREGNVSLLDSSGQRWAPSWKLTLADMEEVVRHHFARLAEMARRLYVSAKDRQSIEELDVILMAGNASQFPMAREVVRDAFPQTAFADKVAKGKAVDATSAAGLKLSVARGACFLRNVERFGGKTEIDQSGLLKATRSIAVMVVDPELRPETIIGVGDDLCVWALAGRYKPGQCVQIVEDLGGGDTREIVTFEPGRHFGFVSTITLDLLLDERGQIMVRMTPDSADPLVLNVQEIISRLQDQGD